MTQSRSSNSGLGLSGVSHDELVDDAFPQIAWRRRSVPDYDFMRRWSMQHRAPENAETTLCGIRIPWLYVGPGDGRRCGRCERIAARRTGAPTDV